MGDVMRGARSRTVSEQLFAVLLHLFPRRFRARFGGDMRELFRDQARAARGTGGTRGMIRLWLRTVPSLVRSALLERWEAAPFRGALENFRMTLRVGRKGMSGRIGGELRYAGRMLRRSPVFTVVAVVVISLGSGAVTTIFSGMNSVLLRPLPGTADARRLVTIERREATGDGGMSGSYPYYAYLRDNARSLEGVAAWSKASLTISLGDVGMSVVGNIVSGNYFAVLGVRPLLGRFFVPDEDATPMAKPVVVVSEGFWRNRLGGDAGLIGTTVGVNGRPYTLIGVAPTSFRGATTPIVTEAWVPLMMQPQIRPDRDVGDASKAWLWVFGRTKAGVDHEVASREMTALTAAWVGERIEPASFGKATRIRLTEMHGLPADARRTAFGFMALLLAASVLVLLIGGVNVAALLSARAMARRREMAVRVALGAARGQLVRQLLVETLLLFGIGALGGVALASAATGALERLPLPAEIPLSVELSPDLRVLAFALVLSMVTGIAFGLGPALRASRADLATRLRGDTPGGGRRRGLAGDAIVSGQLALSLVLLVAAGLFLRALGRGQAVDPGFQIAGAATAPLNAESWGYNEPRARAFDEALRERLLAVPGVTAVSFVDKLPLTMNSSSDRIVAEGATPGSGGAGEGLRVELANVGPGWFDALAVPIVAGRGITAEDTEHGPRVAVINETLAARLWPDGSALGGTLRIHDERVTVVGIARDARYADLSGPTPAFAYFALTQQWRSAQHLVVRTSGDAARLAPAIRRAVHDIDPILPPPEVKTLAEATSLVLIPQRVAAIVTAALGVVGLLLATVGLYGIIAYSVSRRTRELGVRVALGARRADVLSMIVREGLRLAAAGVAIGLLLAAAAGRVIAGLLFDVSPLDATTFVGMSLVFIATAAFASWLPARRAAGADPLAVLRGD